MEDKLKTRVVSFKNMSIEQDEDLLIKPEERFENLTTHQINTLKLNDEEISSNTSDNLFLKYQIESNTKKFKLQKINPYYSYIPKFYLKELSFAKFAAITYTSILSLFVIGTIILASLVLTSWKYVISPYILLVLIPPFVFLLSKFIFALNKYKNFFEEAKNINFRDEKVLSPNIQKIYRKLKTNYIDINWLCGVTYFVLLLMILVVCLLPIFIYKAHFADFITPITVDNQYTYIALFWSAISAICIIGITHVWVLVLGYVRAANIENFYNYMLIDANEITNIKKAKNKRDAIIVFAIFLTLAFLIWLILRIVKRNQATKVVVK